MFLSSKALFSFTSGKNLTKSSLGDIEIPVLDENYQKIFKIFNDLILNEVNSIKKIYYINVVNNLCSFFLSTNSLFIENINIKEIFSNLKSTFENYDESEDIYRHLSSNKSLISSFILRMNYLFNDNEKDNQN